jgi:exosortase E/protease (VPEID-CTERM system)
MATGLLVFGIALLRQGRRPLVERFLRPHLSRPFFLGHLLTFAVFAQLTSLVVERNLATSPRAEGWVLLWAAAGSASLLCLGAAAIQGIGFEVVLAAGAGGLGAWVAGGSTMQLWGVFGRWTLAVVHTLLNCLFTDVIYQPGDSIIGVGSFTVQILPACSGYEGVGLTWVFLGIYLWYYREELRWPWALLILPIGTVLVWTANAVRITALVALGVWISPDVALGGFHSVAGVLIFNCITLGLVAVTQRSQFLARPSAPSAGRNPAASYLVPLLTLVAATMIGAALSNVFDAFYPLRVVAVAAVLWFFRREYARWNWGWSWRAAAVGIVAFALWMALEPLAAATTGGASLGDALAGLPKGWALAWLVFRVVGSVITVPLAEELAFRGYLLRRLTAADFQSVPPGQYSWLALILSSAIFGLLHQRWIAGTLVGILYAGALRRRGQLSDAVLAHATTNLLIAGLVLTTGKWSLWS